MHTQMTMWYVDIYWLLELNIWYVRFATIRQNASIKESRTCMSIMPNNICRTLPPELKRSMRAPFLSIALIIGMSAMAAADCRPVIPVFTMARNSGFTVAIVGEHQWSYLHARTATTNAHDSHTKIVIGAHLSLFDHPQQRLVVVVKDHREIIAQKLLTDVLARRRTHFSIRLVTGSSDPAQTFATARRPQVVHAVSPLWVWGETSS